MVAVSFVLLCLSSSAWAGKVAALIPQVRPNASPELQNRFHEAVSRGLAGPDADVVPTGEVRLRLAESAELLGCAQPGICAARAATALKTERVVAVEVSAFGKDYIVRLVMLDSAGREIARTEENCDICTLKEADDAASRAAARLMLTARTNPNTAPPTQPPPAKSEPTPPTKTEPTPPAAKTEPVPPGVSAAPPLEKKRFPYKWVGVGSLILGVVGIAAGAPLIVIDGEPTCDLPNPRQNCKDVWDTKGGGAALVTIGVLGVAAGISLIVVDVVVKKRNTRLSVAPTLGGAMLTSQWQF
jgi:hypothetical protein